jgi:DNA repair exonuclease SbcCD nuclease subunit
MPPGMSAPFRIFQTADVHLGMKFSSYGDLQQTLSDGRFRSLEKMVQTATEKQCQLLVVSGDLFDRVSVPKRDVERAAQILSGFGGALVAILPGNHDYFEDRVDSLWSVFMENSGGKVLLLSEKKLYDLAEYDLDGVHLYAAPCRDKHSKSNATDWVTEAKKSSEAKHVIGVAHGSLEGLSFDREGSYYPMTRQGLVEAGVDFWLMGHIHVRHPVEPEANARIFYPGTPEPDGFDCSHRGTAWLIEAKDRKNWNVEAVPTGLYRFDEIEKEVSSLSEVKSLVQSWVQKTDGKQQLLKLVLSGRLGREEFRELSQELESLRQHLLHLKAVTETLQIRVTQEEIDREFTEGSFPHRLLSQLATQTDEPEALQIAYELLGSTGKVGR